MDILHAMIEKNQHELIAAVQSALTIRSVEALAQPGMPFGRGVDAALQNALVLAASMGFHTVNLDGYVGYAEYGYGEDYVAVLGHLDVVPEGENWQFPPFDGEIQDGKLYGRGAIDDKGPLLAALFGLKAIKDSGTKLSRKVRIIFGTNEETGCRDMEYYLAREKPPLAGFTPDADFPVIFGEKGAIRVTIRMDFKNAVLSGTRVNYITGGDRLNIVPNYCEAGLESDHPEQCLALCNSLIEKARVKITASLETGLVILRSYGVAAHASMPELGTNAVLQLVSLLAAVNVAGDAGKWLAVIDRYVGCETDGCSLGVNMSDPISGQLTVNAGVVRLDEQGASLGLDIRFPVTCDSRAVGKAFETAITNIGLQVVSMDVTSPLYFPQQHPLIQILQTAFVDVTGLKLSPIAIGGGTYAKSIPNIAAFGPQLPGKPNRCHQTNEYIEIEELLLCAKVYAQAIYKLAL